MIIFILIVLFVVGVFLWLKQPVFGDDPAGERLQLIKKSPHYKNDAFQNLNHTPIMLPTVSYPRLMWSFFFGKPANTEPSKRINAVKADLKSLSNDEPFIVWFGHSSYLLKTNGKNYLIDPVLSGNASPVSLFAKSFSGADVYSAEDFPELDGIIITHDHYDHLDYRTIVKLISKTKHFYTALGVGSHLVHWGVDSKKITEFDWYQSQLISEDVQLTAAPARHFSGRSFKRFKTLWVSFILKTSTHSFYLGGDSGYDNHFKAIGEKYGPFDIALLECGQYNEQWPYIHMKPEETVQASIDLKANVLMPVHWGKFSLSLHAWNEPVERVIKEAERLNVQLITPRIGEPIEVANARYQMWWRF